MRLDAAQRKRGRPSKENYSQVGNNFGTRTSSDELAEKVGESKNQIFRYVRLNSLVPDLQKKVDDGSLKFNPAVELSYLSPTEQNDFLDYIESQSCSPSLSQAQKLKTASKDGALDHGKLLEIMDTKKPSVPPRDPTLTISVSKIARYFPAGYTQEQMVGIIMQLLERNSRHLMPENNPVWSVEMAEYRYYLIPDFMSHVFLQQFEEQAPTEFFSNTADLMKRYQQLREMPYNNEYTWNERTNLPYPRLTVGIDRRDPDGAVTIMQVRNGVNYLCDDYRGPFADRNDKQLIEMAKQLVTAVGVDRIRPHYYTEVNGHTKVHVGKDIHITEWANAPELCSALRFSRFLNRDGQQLFQVRNGQRIIENYADGSRLVKDVQTVDDTHFYVGSRFCHIQQYASQCFKRGCYVEPEHPQPGDKLDRLLIYQIPHYTCEYRFTDYDYAQNKLKATELPLCLCGQHAPGLHTGQVLSGFQL